MKKRLSFLLAAFLLAGCLSACAGENKAKDSENTSPSVVTTIFPEYDWVKTILGENPAGVDLTMLLDNGVDLHSYQPTASDILKISNYALIHYGVFRSV